MINAFRYYINNIKFMQILFNHTFSHSVTTLSIYTQSLISRMAIQESTRTVY